MSKRPWRRWLALGSLAAAALALGRVALWRPLEVSGPRADDGFARVGGVVHVHTTASDGGGTPDEVVAAAERTGLDFVAITDHNNLDAKPVEGYHGRVLVIVGSELSTTAGHLLGLGIEEPAYRFSGDARDGLEDIRDLGGFAVAAHPTNPRPDFRWTGWDLPGSWGLELMNGDSEWRGAGSWSLFRLAGLYAVNHRYALLSGLRAPTEALAQWDQVLARRDAPGLVGADAHSRIPLTRQRSLRFPSYESLFSLARNHVLIEGPLRGDAGRDTRVVVEALARGRSYVALDALAPADDFSFTAQTEGRTFTMGDTVAPSPGLRLRTRGAIPSGATVTLRRNGAVVAESNDALDAAADGPGVYRVEVRVPGWAAPWLLSNPIYVFGTEEAAARKANAAWPDVIQAPPPAVVLDDFSGTTIFEQGHDPGSSMAVPLVDPAGGLGGGGAACLQFRLGASTPSQPFPFAAMVAWGARDLRGRQGLVFSIRADGIYRIWVQVRDRNPASRDEGTEWWFASVRTSGDWRRVAIPFARLRSINPNTDGRLDLDQVRALVFVVDRGSVKAGTEGRIWIDDVGLY